MTTKVGEDLQETTRPQPKREFHFHPPDSTGELTWAAGQTLQQVLAQLPAALRSKTLPFDAKLFLRLDVREV